MRKRASDLKPLALSSAEIPPTFLDLGVVLVRPGSDDLVDRGVA